MNGQVKHENKSQQQLLTPSRIPVSTSVFSFPLRRWGSLKISSGNQQLLLQDPPMIKLPKVIQETNRNGINSDITFQRGYSFMERGEKKRGAHGVRPSAMAIRPHLNTTEPRNLGALNRANPKSPNRNQNLSLSFSSVRRPSSSKSPLGETPKTPPSSPDTRNKFYRDWDLDSVTSTNSGLSVTSCDHPSVAHNGTTFSGKTKRFVVHCSEHAGAIGDEYLTPTQRAHKEVKKLKSLLQQTQRELDTKNTDILRLTKEVVELRIYKAALNSPEDKSTSSDGITVREVIETPLCVDGIVENHNHVDRVSSGADSGHFDDFINASVHFKDSVHIEDETSLSPYKRRNETADKAVTADLGPRDPNSEHQRLVVEYERQLQDLVRTHENECHLMKQKHNDKVDELLLRLSDVNARYWELVPDLDSARERIKELEKELDEVSKKLEEKESYFELYSKGKSDNQIASNEDVGSPMQNPTRVSVPELLHQLEVTQNELDKVKDLDYASSSNTAQPLLSAKEAVSLWVLGARKAMYHQLMEARSKNKVDPEITLQFLKSAIYYFLTDKENNQGHLKAIQSILGFTPNEISNIDKARMAS